VSKQEGLFTLDYKLRTYIKENNMVKNLKLNRQALAFPVAGIALGIAMGSLFLDGNILIGILVGIILSAVVSLLLTCSLY
jgi:cobalamin synthase